MSEADNAAEPIHQEIERPTGVIEHLIREIRWRKIASRVHAWGMPDRRRAAWSAGIVIGRCAGHSPSLPS